MKLELEASNCFEVEWFLDYHNIIRIFFEYSKKLNFKWLAKKNNKLVICYWKVQVKHKKI